MEKIIVGIGELLWDVLPEGKVLGGAPANFAYHASQFGFDGYAVSAVGNDPLGNEIRENLKSKKLNHIVETVSYPTGTVQVKLDAAGVPQYEIRENVAWDNIPFTSSMETLARSAQAVCFGSLARRSPVSRDTTRKFLSLVPGNAYKVFDINLRQHFYTRELIDESFSACNILKINEDEIKIVTGMFYDPSLSEIETCKKLLGDYRLKMVVLTKGTCGSYVITPEEISFRETPVVRVADTVGAGDSFSGAFVAALLSGKSVCEAHRIGVEVSAYVCTCHGAMPELPAAVVALLHS